MGHLHGLRESSASTIITRGASGPILQHPVSLALRLGLLMRRPLLFIGVGGGMIDPNPSLPWTKARPLARRVLLLVGSLLAGNVVAQSVLGVLTVRAGRPLDFVAPAAAARLLAAGSRCLYCAAPLFHAESVYLSTPSPKFFEFMNPPAAAVVLMPLAELPPVVGFSLFQVVSLAALGLGGWLLVSRCDCPPWVTMLGVLSLPAALGFAWGQWDALLFLALTGALVLLERRPVLAGLLLSVLAIKVQAVWLVPVVLIAMRRWRLLRGVGLGALAFVGSTLAILGSHWAEWPAAVVQTSSSELTGTVGLPAIVATYLGSEAGFLATAAGGALSVLAIFRWRRPIGVEPALAIAAAVALSLLLAPHSVPHDYLLAVPALALASRGRLRAGVGAAVVLSGAVALGASVLGLIAVVAFAFTQAVHSGYWLQRPILQPRLNPGGFQSQEVDAIGPPSVR